MIDIRIADMQAVGGAVIADIGGDRAGGEARVERREIGALMDEAAFGGHGQKAERAFDMAGSSSTKQWRALGLMSGTSLDGIDVAAVTTDAAGASPQVQP